MLEFSKRVGSEEFAQLARHPDCRRAFVRRRKLPRPELTGALLSMRNQSQQAMLDGFFASVDGSPTLRREVSDRAFAKARDHLHLPALESLNDLVVRRCDEDGLISRWNGLRVVAGDASLLMPAVQPCLRLVRQIAPNGQVPVLATNLQAQDFAAPLFADIHHQRWRIEEAFKRLKHRLHLEAVSGLSQQALIIDVAAKVPVDNLTSLMCEATITQANLTARSRQCNYPARQASCSACCLAQCCGSAMSPPKSHRP